MKLTVVIVVRYGEGRGWRRGGGSRLTRGSAVGRRVQDHSTGSGARSARRSRCWRYALGRLMLWRHESMEWRAGWVWF
jgi:hypothetical protein